jgi:hypothetical protein
MIKGRDAGGRISAQRRISEGRISACRPVLVCLDFTMLTSQFYASISEVHVIFECEELKDLVNRRRHFALRVDQYDGMMLSERASCHSLLLRARRPRACFR